jgi:hypothetical protein
VTHKASLRRKRVPLYSRERFMFLLKLSSYSLLLAELLLLLPFIVFSHKSPGNFDAIGAIYFGLLQLGYALSDYKVNFAQLFSTHIHDLLVNCLRHIKMLVFIQFQVFFLLLYERSFAAAALLRV